MHAQFEIEDLHIKQRRKNFIFHIALKFERLMHLKKDLQWGQMQQAKDMKKRVKEQERKFWINKHMNQQFHDVILKLNRQALDLNQETIEMDWKVEQLVNWMRNSSIISNCSCGNYKVSPHSTSQLKKPKKIFEPSLSLFDEKKLRLETFPSNCLQHILSYLSFEKVSHLRRVCKHFNETCKKVLNKGFETIKAEVEFCNHIFNSDFYLTLKFEYKLANLFKDLKMLILYCEGAYKCYLKEKYYFSAGKVLDIFYRIVILKEYLRTSKFNLGSRYYKRPNPYFIPLITLTHQAIGHFQDIFMPKCHHRKFSPNYTPNFLTSGDVNEMKGSYKKQVLLKIKNMAKKLNEEEEKVKKLNERNRKSLKRISKLKISVDLLKQEVLEKRQRLSECGQQYLNLFPVKFNHNNNCAINKI